MVYLLQEDLVNNLKLTIDGGRLDGEGRRKREGNVRAWSGDNEYAKLYLGTLHSQEHVRFSLQMVSGYEGREPLACLQPSVSAWGEG